jgi:Ca2+-dependent lipid-binding protein
VIQVIAGRLSRRGRLEVLIDESSWPAFSTAKARSHRQTWDQIGEVFVRELDFSRITLRLHENDENEKEDVYAQVQVDTRNLLESAIVSRWVIRPGCLDLMSFVPQMQPTTFTLSSPGNGGERSTVLLSARYVPVQIALEPRESINSMLHVTWSMRLTDPTGQLDMGLLRVELVDGKDIRGVDRSGKSDVSYKRSVS